MERSETMGCSQIHKINRLLSDKEIASLLMHLLNKDNPLATELQPNHQLSRAAAAQFKSVIFGRFKKLNRLNRINSVVSVDKKVNIRLIRTTIEHSTGDPEPEAFFLVGSAKLDLEMEKFVDGNKGCFKFADQFVLEANQNCQIVLRQFIQQSARWSSIIPVQIEAVDGFTLSNVNTARLDYHLIEKIEFLDVQDCELE